MMMNPMTTGTFAKGKKPKADPARKATTPFPEEEAVMSIYDRPIRHESQCKLKLMSFVVSAIRPTTLEYLRWSESPITFNQTNHLNSIPKPGRFSLIVNLLVGMT
jgi:hypothetical protein